MRNLLLILFCFMISQENLAQAPFQRGVNLTGWFQAENARKIQFRKFRKKDFIDIKGLGCDAIRLPVNLHGMTSGEPDFTIDPLFISFLDSAVNWAEELHLYLLIDNHSFDPSVNTSPDIGQILVRVWAQIAGHYKDRSNYILYEMLNEPHGISNQLWGNIQQQTIDAIRTRDTRHTIIVGPSGFNSYNDLDQMPVYTDTNLLYTFHFYDPFLFTHQGASWSTPSMEPLSGVPFPFGSASMPACPPSLVGTWVENSLNNYSIDGTIARVKSLIDIAVNFRNTRNVEIFCGEFGVYMPNSDTADRVFWYQTVKDYFGVKEIPWTIWDYKGGFGLFKKGSFELFESDLNIPLLGALGFNIPEQHAYHTGPDSIGFRIYDDYIEKGINEASYSTGTIDFYSTLLPNNENYCLFWTGGPQYTKITLDFVPVRDLSRLVNTGYAMDMLVRGNVAGIKIDMRFLDTKTSDPTDHQWRMRTTLSDATPGWDKRWHHLHIPLQNFTEQGAWDDGNWYEPEGKFDWSAIERLEIVAEYGSMDSKEVWFDNITITNLDTARVFETGTLGIYNQLTPGDIPDLYLIPNPMNSSLSISYELRETGPVRLSVYDISGRKVSDIVDKIQSSGTYLAEWNGKNESGNTIPDGVYICRLLANNHLIYCKLIKATD
jgi:endoglucanase